MPSQHMDGSPDRPTGPLSRWGSPAWTLTLVLPLKLLLLLLGSVLHTEGLIPALVCPHVTAAGGLPNCTVQAGGAFLCKLPLRALLEPTQHYQVSSRWCFS